MSEQQAEQLMQQMQMLETISLIYLKEKELL